jgi:glutamate 5-kinase
MRLVVKVGTSTVHNEAAEDSVTALSAQVAAQVRAGHSIAVFSSGAVRCGRELTGLPDLPAAAAAAVGQPVVYGRWRDALAARGVATAQVLVGDRDLQPRAAAGALVEALWSAGIVPILNGNDAIAHARAPVADNDALACALSLRVGADRLVLLTDQDGLCTADPRVEPGARPIAELGQSDLANMAAVLAAAPPGPHGRGGMLSKVHAALAASRGGVGAVIANGRNPDVLAMVVAGRAVGTRVAAVTRFAAAAALAGLAEGAVGYGGD